MGKLTERLETHEQWGLIALLVLHVVTLPLLIFSGMNWWDWDFFGLSTAGINAAYYLIDLVMCFFFAGSYLRRSFDSLLDHPVDGLLAVAFGFVMYYLLNLAVNLLCMPFDFFQQVNPNQSNLTDIARQSRGTIIAMTVLMAPIVEETAFRGGIFCGLYHKNRLLAYVVCVAAFALYHVWQGAFLQNDPSYLLFAVRYLPASVALCWCYDRGGSLWACIALHMLINSLSLVLM